MVCEFSDKQYEKIRFDLVEKITLENFSCEQTINFILSKYERSLVNLTNQKNFFCIINNRSFALQYLRDTMCILRKVV